MLSKLSVFLSIFILMFSNSVIEVRWYEMRLVPLLDYV